MERIAKLVLVMLAVILVVIGAALLIVWYYGLGPRTEALQDEPGMLSTQERQTIIDSLGPEATSSPYYYLNAAGEMEITPEGRAVMESLGAN
jgi:hypothetical protein